MSTLGYKLDKNIIDPKTGEPPVIKTLQQFVVWKFLRNPREVNWGKEGKVATKLLELCSDVEFWNFVDLPFKLNSLCWLLTPKGLAFLSKETERKRFIDENGDFVKREKVTLSEKLIGENVEVSNKPKSLMDFIKKV